MRSQLGAGPATGPSASYQTPNASQLTITFTALFPAGAGAAAQALSAELQEQSAKLLSSVIAGHGPVIISGALYGKGWAAFHLLDVDVYLAQCNMDHAWLTAQQHIKFVLCFAGVSVRQAISGTNGAIESYSGASAGPAAAPPPLTLYHVSTSFCAVPSASRSQPRFC